MNIFVLVVVGMLGVGLGMYLACRRPSAMLRAGRSKWGSKKEKIVAALRGSREKRITNDEVQELLGVSDATATRYLDKLEKEGKVRQVGETGAGVYYTLK